MSTSLSAALAFLETARFEDLLIPGVVWRDETPPRVTHASDDVYLRAEGGGLLRFTGVGSHGGLRLRITHEIAVAPGLAEEFGDDAVSVSLWNLYFDDDSHALRCREAVYFTDDESDTGRGVVRAMELTFAPNHTLFLDPMSVSGIKLRTAGGAARFLADGPFDPEGALRRHVWTAHQK